MVLKIYNNLMSQPARAILLFLKINNIPYENVFVNLAKGENLTEEYEKLNPLKKIPIIDDNGFILRERSKMVLKIYNNLMSQPARAILLFLKINNIPYENVFVNLAKGENLTEEYEKLNPLKKIPIIDDNGFILRESVGILRYLCRERDVPDHWYPKDSKQQAKVDEYLEWQHLDTRANCAMFFQHKYLLPQLFGKSPDKKLVDLFEERMKTTLHSIEDVWLKDSPYLIGDKITIADLLGVCEIEQPRMAGYDPRTEYPKIAAWIERVRQDLSPHYDEVNKVLNKVAAKAKL